MAVPVRGRGFRGGGHFFFDSVVARLLPPPSFPAQIRFSCGKKGRGRIQNPKAVSPVLGTEPLVLSQLEGIRG